jgi:hypothetical protein
MQKRPHRTFVERRGQLRWVGCAIGLMMAKPLPEGNVSKHDADGFVKIHGPAIRDENHGVNSGAS